MELEQRKYETPADVRLLADILRQRAGAGWNTLLSAKTAVLVAEALEAYAPAAPPHPLPAPPGSHLDIDMYSTGSTIFKLDRHGEILEIAAWARSTLVADAAFDKLVKEYENERFMQKRRSWVERE